MHRARFIPILAGAMILAACETPTPPEKISFDLKTSGVKAGVDFSTLSRILDEAVSGGRMDMKEYRVNELEKDLVSQLRLLAVTGPGATPALFKTREDRLAYWLNARASWAIRFAVEEDDRDEDDKTERGDFPLDGRRMTLDQIDAHIYSFLGAAPGTVDDRAPLPGEPFSAKTIDDQARKNFNAFIDDGDRIILDIERKQVLVPAVIWKYRERYIQSYRRTFGAKGEVSLLTALLPVTSGSAHRRLQNAVGYACRAK
jgi:hypothetical protein